MGNMSNLLDWKKFIKNNKIEGESCEILLYTEKEKSFSVFTEKNEDDIVKSLKKSGAN